MNAFVEKSIRHVEVPNSKQCKLFEYDLLLLDTMYRWKEGLAYLANPEKSFYIEMFCKQY